MVPITRRGRMRATFLRWLSLTVKASAKLSIVDVKQTDLLVSSEDEFTSRDCIGGEAITGR
jgi:hypothetical protein